VTPAVHFLCPICFVILFRLLLLFFLCGPITNTYLVDQYRVLPTPGLMYQILHGASYSFVKNAETWSKTIYTNLSNPSSQVFAYSALLLSQNWVIPSYTSCLVNIARKRTMACNALEKSWWYITLQHLINAVCGCLCPSKLLTRFTPHHLVSRHQPKSEVIETNGV